MLLLGLDIGTTLCKAVVFDTQGNQLAEASREYPVIHPQLGWMEIDPGRVRDSIFQCIRECTDVCGSGQIHGVAVSSQGEAMIPVGYDGNPLANSIITFDHRNVAEFEAFLGNLGREEAFRISGQPPHTMFSLTKLMWIQNKMPGVFEKTWKFMDFGGFIAHQLGADSVMDYTMAARTMAFDIRHKTWCDRILDTCGISKALLPDLVPPGTRIGRVHPERARELGLSPETEIVSGAHDQLCCCLGAGVLDSGIAMDSLGTTESIVCIADNAVVTPKMIDINLCCYPYVIDGYYAYLTFLSSSGAILKWMRNQFFPHSAPNFFQDMDRAAAERFKAPSGLFVLPHFAGSGTPYLDFNSMGIIAGLNLGTEPVQIYKAFMEGTAFEGRINIENMVKCGIPLRELRCVGGGARSDVWLQIKADITGKPIQSLRVKESGCLGAAMLAGWGCHDFHSLPEAADLYVKENKCFTPDADRCAQYEGLFERYKGLYAISKDLFKDRVR